MYKESTVKNISEAAFFIVLGYFVYESHGWALGFAVGWIGIMLLLTLKMGRDIINRLSALHDRPIK